MIEALQVMYEGCLGTVQGIVQALDAFRLQIQEGHAQALDALDAMKKTQECHAQALDALEPMKKTQAEHFAQLYSVERRFRQIWLRIYSLGSQRVRSNCFDIYTNEVQFQRCDIS